MVYLIHFEAPYKHTRHYIGFTDSESPEARLTRHRKGNGSRLLRAVSLAGIDYSIVKTWPYASRNFEYTLKLQRNHKRLCPVCNPTGDNDITKGWER